jgi:hypothetical protein
MRRRRRPSAAAVSGASAPCHESAPPCAPEAAAGPRRISGMGRAVDEILKAALLGSVVQHGVPLKLGAPY